MRRPLGVPGLSEARLGLIPVLIAQNGSGFRHRFEFMRDDLGAVHRATRERAEAAIGVEENALRKQVL